MKERIEEIKQKLHSLNLKLTPQREATLKIMLEHEEDHLTAEDIYLLVKNMAPEIGLATVYRTLELLSNLNIIQKLNFGDNVARYEFRSLESEHHHHHLICIECGRIEEISEDWLMPIEERVEEQYDFKIVDHRLIFNGICISCQRDNKKYN